MIAAKPLIAELENAVKGGSVKQRITTLNRISDLFLNSAERFNEDQVCLFDNVLLHLVKVVESKALVELSRRFAPVSNAPIKVIHHLAHHDDISVAGPVLSQSERLSTPDLIEITKKKSQEHLLAITDRPKLVEAVTDALLERGNDNVYCKLATNHSASFSQSGLECLINRAKNDETLVEKVAQRIDIPRNMLIDLVSTATQAVRIKLLATSPTELHDEIKKMLNAISQDVTQEVGAGRRNFKQAQEFVRDLHQRSQLKEPVLYDFALKHDLDKLCAALALLTDSKIELIDQLIQTVHYAGLLVACRVADLKWPTVEAILQHRFPKVLITKADLDQAMADFNDINKFAAVRLLGYWQAGTQYTNS